MSDERFTTPSSFGHEPGTPWPDGVTPPKLGDPLYPAYSAARFGYELNGRRYRFGADGKPEEIDTNAKDATPQSGDKDL